MVKYHDEEWGVPLHDDRRLFEFLTLEGAQAGLRWLTVLKKLQNYIELFARFDPKKVARFSKRDANMLMKDPRIIRNKLKIESTINNATRFLEVKEEFGSFDRYIWGFVDGKPIKNKFTKLIQLPTKTTISDAISKDLKKRGFKFIGSTICYAHMQATGMVNDHLTSCFRYKQV